MKYSEEHKKELFDAVIARIEGGLSLRKAIIAVNDDFLTDLSRATFYDWKKENSDLEDQYARACDARYDFLLDEIRDIADDTSQDSITIRKGDYEYEVENKEFVNRSKVKIDVRKWELSKLAPKKFGDRLAVDAEVKSETKIQIDYDKLSDAALEEIVNAARNANDSPES